MSQIDVLRVAGGQFREFGLSGFSTMKKEAGYTGGVFQRSDHLIFRRSDHRMAFQLNLQARALFDLIGTKSAKFVIEEDAGRLDTAGVAARDGSNAFIIDRAEVHYLESVDLDPVRPKSFTLLFDVSIGEPISETFRAARISEPPGTRYWARTDVWWVQLQEFYEFQSSSVFPGELRNALRDGIGLEIEKPFTDPLRDTLAGYES